MKDLLQSLTKLSEGDVVHKGEYGNKYGKEDVRDQYGHKIGRVDKGEKAKAEAPKKGRGRPKKDTGETGAKFDSSALNNVFGGKKPSKAVGTVSKKNSLKEYMESVEDTKHAEAIMESMFEGVNHSSLAQYLGKLAQVIKSVQTPEQFAVAQKYAQRMRGAIMSHQHDNLSFGKGLAANMGVMRAVDADLAAKAKELGIEFKPLEEQLSPAEKDEFDRTHPPEVAFPGYDPVKAKKALYDKKHPAKVPSPGNNGRKVTDEDEQITVAPAQQNTQVIKQGNNVLGSVTNPTLAATIKNALSKGEMSIGGAPVQESKQKVDESISLSESPETLQHIINKYKHEVKNFINNPDDFMDDDLYDALFDYYFNAGEMPYGVAKARSGDPFEWIADRFSQDVHDYVLDENSYRDLTQHALKEPTSNFTTVGAEPGSMAAPRGAKTQINRPVPEPTPWSRDPIAAASDRAFNFIDSLKKKTPFTEGSDMKDIQLEGWEKQLKGLLTEGLTVSTSTGQQGQPNSVTVSASEGDADQLMQVLRSAGIGGFGAEKASPEIGYGVASQGEEEFDGTGTEPQPSPEVVGDDGDMLSMLKKMAGIGGGDAEVVAIGGDEGGEEGEQDYKDEEGSEDGESAGTLEPASDKEGSEEEQDSEEDEESDDEETNEGNAFTGKLKQTPQGGTFKQGGKTYKDKSSIEEGGFDPEQFGSDGAGAPGGAGGGDEEESVEEGIAGDVGKLASAAGKGFWDELTNGQPVGEGALGTLGGAAAGMAMGGPVGAAIGAVGGQEASKGGSSLFDEADGHMCEECGMEESACHCDHVEENFANSANDPSEEEFLKLKALLSVGNDLHKMKTTQAMGNPVRVAESNMINDWKKLSGIK